MADVIQTVTETFQAGGSAQFGGGGPSVSGTWTYQWDVTTNSLVAGQTITADLVVSGTAGTTTFTSGTVSYVGGASQGNIAEVEFATGTTVGGAGYHNLFLDWGSATGTPDQDEAPTSLFTGTNSGHGFAAQYTSVKDASNTYTLHATGSSGGNLVPAITCFAGGTRILTTAGEIAVESLLPGDLVITAAGAALPVLWLGRSTIATRFAEKLRFAPIRIKAGALAANIPARDLLVSPAHAMMLDGVLVQAGALVNGGSIAQETDLPEFFTYYHVELASHEVLIAEGAASESFIDNGDRMSFDNWAEHEALGLASIAEMDLPRAKAHRQVPAAIRAAIAARAAVLAPLAAAA